MNPPLQSPLKTLIRTHGAREKKKLLGASFCLLITAGTTALVAAQLKPIFDDIFIGHKKNLLFYVAGGMLVLFIVKGLSEFLAHRWLDQAGQGFIASLQKALFSHMVSLDIAFFHTHTSGHLVTLLTQDVLVVKNTFLTTLVSMARESATALGLLCVMMRENLTLSLVSFVILPAVGFLLHVCSRKVKKLSGALFNNTASIQSFFQQAFENITVIKSYQTENLEKDTLEKALDDQRKKAIGLTTIRSLVHPVVEVLGGLAIMIVVFYGGYQVIEGGKTTGSFLAFLLALIFIYRPLKAIVHLHGHLQEGKSAANRLMVLFAEQPHRPKVSVQTLYPLNPCPPEIVFSHVTFSYGQGAVLKDFNLVIRPGQKIAFVGPSGGGKTTLFHLLLRFYEPQQGEILFNGKNIAHLSLEDVRQAMTFVSQDIGLFQKSIWENIAYGQKDTPFKDIEKAASWAFAHPFIEKFPQGYDTLLGARGAGLSGGQKQRLTLARAFLRSSPILLLDEVSSALDGDSERKIHEAITHLSKEKTLLLISHRMAKLEEMDAIAVIEEGRLVQYGTHQELIAKEGLYQHLAHLQKILHPTH